jgi:hypothetical protein
LARQKSVMAPDGVARLEQLFSAGDEAAKE